MFKRANCVLLTITVFMLPAFDVALADSPTPASLEQVNEQLQGKVAFIDLADGSTRGKTKKVVVETNFTYFEANGKEQKVETAQILRIRVKSKSKGLLGLAIGAGAGALIALATDAGETTCNEIVQCTSDATSEQLGFLVVVGAGAGFGIGKALPRKQTVVYDAMGSAESQPRGDAPVEE